MTKEGEPQDSAQRVEGWRQRFSSYLQEVMAGDSYVIFPDGGVLPVREPRMAPIEAEITLIDNNNPQI